MFHGVIGVLYMVESSDTASVHTVAGRLVVHMDTLVLGTGRTAELGNIDAVRKGITVNCIVSVRSFQFEDLEAIAAPF